MPTPDVPGDSGAYISVLTAGDAGEAIDRVDAAMHLLTQTRTSVGVAENALIRLVNYLDVRQLNLTAAQGRIRDVDVAAEPSKLTLLQAASEASARALNLSIPSQFEAVSVLLAGIPTPPSSSTAAAAAVVSSRPKQRRDRLYKSPQRATPPRPRRRSRGSRRRGRLAAQRGDAVEEVAARSTQVFLPADSRRPADGARLSGMEILSLSQVPDAVDHLVAESLVETPTSTLRVIRLAPGQTLPPHTHASSDLVMLVVEGRATLDTPDGPRQLDPGDIAVLVGSEELRVGNEGQDNVTLAAFLSPPFPPRS
ncbi:MAG: flagellin [Dermatophilaceae bacterium]